MSLLSTFNLPLGFSAPVSVNAGRAVAKGMFAAVIESPDIAAEFHDLAGIALSDIPLSTEVFEFSSRAGDEVVVREREKGWPLVVRRDGEIIVNFDVAATRAFQFADTKRPLYTYIPGFNVHKFPVSIRRPVSNLLQSLRAPKDLDVIREYTKLPLTGFEAVLLLLRVLAGAPDAPAFRWPGGKRAVFVSLHDIDTAGFLRRRERDPLFRIEQKHQIKGTWFVPTAILKSRQRVDFLLEAGNEVGWHDHSHDHRLPFAPYAERRAQILKDSCLARMNYPLGMRTPKLMKSNHLFDVLDRSCLPLRFDTSFLHGIVPYPLWVNGRQSRILEIPTTVPTDIRLYNQLRNVSGPQKYEKMLAAQIARTKKLIEAGALISIVTHPEKDLSERPELLEVYDQYLAFIRTCPNLWFATAGELFNYWTAQAGHELNNDFALSRVE